MVNFLAMNRNSDQIRMNDSKVLLGVTGGIAAYKSAELVRKLKEAGVSVRVVMTEAAKSFITPLTLQALSGEPVFDTLLDEKAEQAMGHIALARWADRVLIAPASADFMARLTYGHANDLLTTICLATKAPILLAPAMNRVMWENPATQHNKILLSQRGIECWGPDEGAQACGETGLGRMRDPASLARDLLARLRGDAEDPHSAQSQLSILQGKKILITAGPTQEPIDPLRYMTNNSSGKMGYALARAAHSLGAEVIIISGPVNQICPDSIRCISIKTAAEMLDKVMEEVKNADIFIATAAVADYRTDIISDHKIKKTAETLDLHLVRNPDIMACVAALNKPPFIVGFAAETQNLLSNAKEKLISKKADLIFANDVSQPEIGFNAEDNEVIAISSTGEKKFPRAHKNILARQLINYISEAYYEKNPI